MNSFVDKKFSNEDLIHFGYIAPNLASVKNDGQLWSKVADKLKSMNNLDKKLKENHLQELMNIAKEFQSENLRE